MDDERFDDLLKQIREEGAPAEQVKAAQNRVWQRLNASGSQVRACDEFGPLLADYAHGRLGESRRLL